MRRRLGYPQFSPQMILLLPSLDQPSCDQASRQPAEAHLARLALKHVAQTPTLRAAAPDAQIEAATVSVETRFARRRDGPRRQSIQLVSHKTFRPIPRISP